MKEKEYNIKVTESEVITMYEALLYYMEEAEIPKTLEKSVETLMNKIAHFLKIVL